MKGKNIALIFMSIFSVFLFASIVTAGVTFTATGNSVTADQGDTVTVTFSVTEDGTGDLTDITFNTPVTLTSGSNTLDSASTITGVITELDENETSSDMTLNFVVAANQAPGTYTGNLTLTGNYTSEESFDLPIQIVVNEPVDPEPEWKTDFCEWDGGVSTNPGELDIEIDDIKITGFGDDESFFPFDEIEIEVKIENDGDDDVDNIEIEWGLYDHENEEWVIDVDDEDEVDVKDGDDEIITFTFTIDDDMDVDLEDLDDGDHYTLYVRATGEVDDGDDTDTCHSDKQDIEIVIEKDFVIATNFDLSQDVVSCGSDLNINADIYNVGEDDQDDVTVRVKVRDLDYDEEIDIGDIDAFEREKLDITIQIPEDAEEKNYVITFEVYDEDDDIYENDFDDDESRTTTSFQVQGSCSTSPGETPSDTDLGAIVSANLESGGNIGEPLVIKAMITNTGSESGTFLVNVAGYVSWADLASLDKDTLILGPGDTDEVIITMQVKPDSAGDQLFNIQVVADQQIVADQPVSVTIQGSSSAGLTDTFGDNWYLWLIGILNVILIIIIIIVAIRLAKK